MTIEQMISTLEQLASVHGGDTVVTTMNADDEHEAVLKVGFFGPAEFVDYAENLVVEDVVAIY